MKKYILIPYANLNIGGVPTKIIDIVNVLETTHPDITIRILLQKGHHDDQRVRIQNPRACVIDFWFPLPFGRKPAYILWLWCNIFLFRPTAVLAFLSPYALPILLAKKIFFWLPFRVVVSEDHYTRTMLKRMVAPKLQQVAIRLLYPYADAVIIPTRAIEQQLRLLCRLPADKTRVIYNWTTLADTPLSKTKRIWDIIHIGRLVQSKNPYRIVSLMSQYVKAHPNTSCAIVGEGEEAPRIKRFINQHRLGKHIILYPATSDVSMYLRQAKIFVFLPEAQTEGFPMVLLEAMACGAVVVTEQFNGVKEILTDGQSGFVVPTSTVTPSFIYRAVKNYGDIQKYARAFVKKNCSPQNIRQYISALDTTYT